MLEPRQGFQVDCVTFAGFHSAHLNDYYSAVFHTQLLSQFDARSDLEKGAESATLLCYTVICWRFEKRLFLKDFCAV